MKRIITCSDGTWNKPNMKYGDQVVKTNVQLIFDCIAGSGGDMFQIKHYDAGVGSEGSFLSRIFSGATGDGIDANILSAYKFICWNYEPGDEIYLFGFSRGAYTARSLAGLIRKCGIIKTNDLNLFDTAYALYRNKEVRPDMPEAIDFRTQNSFTTKIKFIGVWDTVGALGIPVMWFQWYNKQKYSFYDTTLSSMVDNAYHAVAIDEKRKNFEPTLWQRSEKMASQNPTQVLEQRWFAGTHSNVGGGYPDTGLSDITLRWMIDNARKTGLRFNEAAISKIEGRADGTLYNSKKGIFSLLPDFLRMIETGSAVDESVEHRIAKVADYRPTNPQHFKR